MRWLIPTPNYYSILLASVRYNKELNDSEKILYSEITALSNKNGYCHASNKYFSTLYAVSKRTVQRRLSKLHEYGFIEIIYASNDNNKFVSRKIYIKDYPVTPTRDNIVTIMYDDSVTPVYDANVTPTHDKSVIYNNTSIFNTTSVNSTRKNNIKDIIQQYNEICISLIPYNYQENDTHNIIQLINSDIDIPSLFKQFESSDFLTGRTGQWAGCNFSWIIKPTNIKKILNGQYDNPKPKESTGNVFLELAKKM